MKINQAHEVVGLFPRNPRITVVGCTGSTAGGKSSLIKKADTLRDIGNIVITVTEAARDIMEAGLHPVKSNWKYDRAFQEAVFQLTLQKENLLYEAACALGGSAPIILLCDRGLLDGEAYLGPTAFAELMEKYHVTRSQVLARYDMIINMVTAAIGAEEHYVNDKDRIEPLEEAITLQVWINEAWKHHPRYVEIDNSTGFDEKLGRAFAAITDEVGCRVKKSFVAAQLFAASPVSELAV